MSQSKHIFTHLSIAEREEISILFATGAPISAIARRLNRSPSTISRELHRYKNTAAYRACLAQTRANIAKRRCRKPTKSSDYNLLHKIERMLKKRWSPMIIVQKLGHIISHTTIYSIIKTIRTEWRKFLIYQRKAKYHKGAAGKSLIPYRTDISVRPAEIMFGDWEADTVVSASGGKACLGVFAERTTRLYRVVKMANKSAAEMTRATLVALCGMHVNSITYDNGSENADHWVTNKLLNCASYFCRPYRSGDKGLVEERNKLLRVWLPKGTKFDLITDEELIRIENEINERPMEVLGWLSPSEALALHLEL